MISLIKISSIFVELALNSLRSDPSLLGGKKASILFGNQNSNDDNVLASSSSNSFQGLGSLFKTSTASSKYPLTSPIQTEKGLKYHIGIISDLDTEVSKKQIEM